MESLVSAWKNELDSYRRSGALRNTISLSNVKRTTKWELVLTLLAPAYARILDIGGPVPIRESSKISPRTGRQLLMRFQGRNGETVYARRLRGFDYPPRHWVVNGFEDFWRRGGYGKRKPVVYGWPEKERAA